MSETLPEQLVHNLPEESGLGPADKDELLKLYREMLLIRRVEELAAKAYTQRKISWILPPLHRPRIGRSWRSCRHKKRRLLAHCIP